MPFMLIRASRILPRASATAPVSVAGQYCSVIKVQITEQDVLVDGLGELLGPQSRRPTIDTPPT